MSDNVVKIAPATVGDDYMDDVEEVLNAARGSIVSDLVVIGITAEGGLHIGRSNISARSVFVMEQAKHLLMFGDE